MRFHTTRLILLAAVWALPVDVWAELRFCNRTGSNASVAIAYVQKDAPGTTTNQHRGVTLEGWWIFAPGECASVSDLHVGDHWVYYHAHSTDGTWAGDAMLCIPSRRFTNGDRFRRPDEGCPAGSRLRGFRRIQSDARTFTMTLR